MLTLKLLTLDEQAISLLSGNKELNADSIGKYNASKNFLENCRTF